MYLTIKGGHIESLVNHRLREFQVLIVFHYSTQLREPITSTRTPVRKCIISHVHFYRVHKDLYFTKQMLILFISLINTH